MSTKKVATGVDLLRNPDIAQFLTPNAPLPEQLANVPPPPVPPAPKVEEVAEKVEEEIAEPEVDDQKKYLQELEKLGVSTTQAAAIIDSMLFKGFYEEEVPVTKKLTVRFRTRDSTAADRLNTAINKENPQFTSFLYTIIANYNLAASLVQYGPHKFDPSTDEGVEKTLNYVKTKIPLPVYQLLVTKLAKFDEKLSAIMKDGAVENFF